MTRARATMVCVDATPYYHCVGRCVRRAYLCGEDEHSGVSYEHRREWMEERLALLTEVFAVDLCAYALMSNHYHLVVKLRPADTAAWSDEGVIERWTQLFAGPLVVQRYRQGIAMSDAELKQVSRHISLWRERLGSLSWFMRCLNEHIARLANAEDGCTGHFWEGRFKSQALLDEAALLSAMAYVDLNPVRAGMASDIPGSDYTSGQVRWQIAAGVPQPRERGPRPRLLPFEGASGSHNSIAPLPFALQDYLAFLDESGRVVRDDKRGFIAACRPKLLTMLGLEPGEWLGAVRQLHGRFEAAMGSPLHMERLAVRRSVRWLRGVRHARRLYPTLKG